MKKPKGIIIYEGPSCLNGDDIVCIINGFRKSQNRKTSFMLQSWIIVKNKHPVIAHQKNADIAICGDCKHRTWGTCYVIIGQAPFQIYNAYKRGSYEYLQDRHISYLKDKHLRIGSYGDPVAVPFSIWQNLLKLVGAYTGYTHQWKSCDDRFKSVVMASVESENEYIKAKQLGWRTFRCLTNRETYQKNEHTCPASINDKINCNICLKCSGKSVNIKKDIAIVMHGTLYKVIRFNKIKNLIRQKKKYTHLIPH